MPPGVFPGGFPTSPERASESDMEPANLNPEHIDVLRRIHVRSGERPDDDRERIAQLALDLKRAGFLRWYGSMLIGHYLITAKGLTRLEIIDAEVAAKEAAEHATATAERLAELRAQGEAIAVAPGLQDATEDADDVEPVV